MNSAKQSLPEAGVASNPSPTQARRHTSSTTKTLPNSAMKSSLISEQTAEEAAPDGICIHPEDGPLKAQELVSHTAETTLDEKKTRSSPQMERNIESEGRQGIFW